MNEDGTHVHAYGLSSILSQIKRNSSPEDAWQPVVLTVKDGFKFEELRGLL